jgi:hypothetical protein
VLGFDANQPWRSIVAVAGAIGQSSVFRGGRAEA